MRRRRLVTGLVSLGSIAAAGCVGTAPSEGSGRPTTTGAAGAVLAVTSANETAVRQAPDTTKAQFDELTADQQDEFRAALEHDVADPTAWDDGTDTEYVRYEETWYSVQVVVVD